MIRRLIGILLCIVIAMLPMHNGVTKNAVPHDLSFANDHIVIKLKSDFRIVAASMHDDLGFGENMVTAICSSLGLELKSVKKLFPKLINSRTQLYNKYELGTYYLAYFKNEVDPTFQERKKHKCILEPDFIGEAAGRELSTPNDRFFKRQWGLNTKYQN
jgi:hypothetical protein